MHAARRCNACSCSVLFCACSARFCASAECSCCTGLLWRCSRRCLVPPCLPLLSSQAPTPHPPPPAARHKHLATTERVIACWFMVTGLIHFVIEGWVVAKADFYKDASGNYLSDTCARGGEGAAITWPAGARVPASQCRCRVGPAHPTKPVRPCVVSHCLPPAEPSPVQGRSTPRPTRATPAAIPSSSPWRCGASGGWTAQLPCQQQAAWEAGQSQAIQ